MSTIRLVRGFEQAVIRLTIMQWSSLAATGHLIWHLNHRHLSVNLAEQGIHLSKADPVEMQHGRLTIGNTDYGLAEPIMILHPEVEEGQWWWAAKTSNEQTTTISTLLREADSECDVLTTATVGFSALSGEHKPVVSHVAETVCAAATTLLDGPSFTAISWGQTLVVCAVQFDGQTPSMVTGNDVEKMAKSVKWSPVPIQREVIGARHLLG